MHILEEVKAIGWFGGGGGEDHEGLYNELGYNVVWGGSTLNYLRVHLNEVGPSVTFYVYIHL